MKHPLRRSLPWVGGVFLVAQFIQPDRSVPATDLNNDMLAVTQAPADIEQLVIGACYDCHSYRTEYPWYAYVAPVSFVVQHHINEGREVLNFSRWADFSGGEEAGESGETIQEGEMPPGYYRFMHGHGRLGDADRQKLTAWFNANMPAGEEHDPGNGAEKEHEEEGEPAE